MKPGPGYTVWAGHGSGDGGLDLGATMPLCTTWLRDLLDFRWKRYMVVFEGGGKAVMGATDFFPPGKITCFFVLCIIVLHSDSCVVLQL